MDTVNTILKFVTDPSCIGLISMAITTIIFSAYQSRALYFHNIPTSTSNSRPSQPPLLATNASIIRKRTAIILPILGSVMLVILFFFLDLIYFLLLGILLFCSFISLCFVQWPFVSYALNKIPIKIPREIPTIRFIGKVPLELFFVLPIPITLVVLYFVFNHWAINNIFALAIAALAMSVLRITNLKVAMIMLIFFFIYDIFWVFVSSLIFGRNVMVVVARNLATTYNYRLPMSIQLPLVFADGTLLLGMGDIILPGFFLCFLYRFDMSLMGNPFQGYFLNACIGYCVGLLLAFIMMFSMQGLAQPALTYLVPCTIVPTLILGFLRKEMKHLLTGSTGRIHALQSPQIVPDDTDPTDVIIQMENISPEEQAILENFDEEPVVNVEQQKEVEIILETNPENET